MATRMSRFPQGLGPIWSRRVSIHCIKNRSFDLDGARPLQFHCILLRYAITQMSVHRRVGSQTCIKLTSQGRTSRCGES